MNGKLPACLLLALAKPIQLPCLEQFAFGRVDAKKVGMFISIPEEHACLFGETEDFREKGAQETCLNISRGNGGFLMSHIGGQGPGLPSQGKEAPARVLGNVTTKGVELEKGRDWLLNRSENKKDSKHQSET